MQCEHPTIDRKPVEKLYSYFVFPVNHQRRISIAPKIGCELGMNDCESNAIFVIQAVLIPNSISNIKLRYSDRIHYWF